MPRAKRRIPVRDGAASLASPVEWELTRWRGLEIGGLSFATEREFALAWEAHRDRLLPAYVEAMPGSRPFGCYATGEIATPPIVEKPYPSDTGRRIGRVVFHDAHCHGIGGEPELEHLVRLGLVDAGEARAAHRRIAATDSRCLYRFTSIDTRGAIPCPS
jgi:hypothetical protein